MLCVVRCALCAVRGVWCVVCGVWCVECGVLCVVCCAYEPNKQFSWGGGDLLYKQRDAFVCKLKTKSLNDNTITQAVNNLIFNQVFCTFVFCFVQGGGRQ